MERASAPARLISGIECYGISPERRPISDLDVDTLMPDRRLRASDFESEGREFESLRARQHPDRPHFIPSFIVRRRCRKGRSPKVFLIVEVPRPAQPSAFSPLINLSSI